VIVPYLGEAAAVAKNLPRAVDLEAFLAPFAPKAVAFERFSFDHPIYILIRRAPPAFRNASFTAPAAFSCSI